MKYPVLLTVFALVASATDAVIAQTSAHVMRLEVGAKEIDGRVYRPHAAKVRIYIGDRPTGAEWTNVLHVKDSAGRALHYWTTTGTSQTPSGGKVTWELRQTYDAVTLQPYSIVRTASNGMEVRLTIDDLRVHGTRRLSANAPVERVDYTLDRRGFVASASDLLPAAVGLKEGRVISVPIWAPGTETVEQRRFTILGRMEIDVEGTKVNASKVEEHRESDNKLIATWYLLDKSPYMVYGEVLLPDGKVQRMTEVELPMPGSANDQS